jgi:hypothetical protein
MSRVSERGNHLRHAAAVIGGIEICHPQPFEFLRLLPDTLNLLAPDEWLVIFDLRKSMFRHFPKILFSAFSFGSYLLPI